MTKRRVIKKEDFDIDLFDDLVPQQVDIKATNVFIRNAECKAKEVFNRGSSGSSKSHSLCQLISYKFITEKKKKILIVRKTLPSLRVSTLWMMQTILDEFGVRPRIREEKQNLNFLYGDNIIHFGSVDDPQKIKSSDWNYIWMEEATEFSYDDYQLIRLYNRAKSHDGIPNQMFLSFNPIDELHWIKKKILDKADDINRDFNVVHEIHSTYKDNPFLPQDTIDKIESLQEQDYNYYRVMGLGEWGRLENLIYNNWRVRRISEFPKEGEVTYGLDFGYNSESALIKCIITGKDREEIWEEQLLYKKKLTNSDLIAEMKKLIPRTEWSRALIYADSAEPDRIKEIKNAGFTRIKEANKNIKDGIDFLKRTKTFISEDSTDLIKEKTAYSWKKNRLTGDIIDEPVDFQNHLMDAERYAIYTHLRGTRDIKIRWL